jgi:homopolymeric O-antigen transport system ATP-binding protein
LSKRYRLRSTPYTRLSELISDAVAAPLRRGERDGRRFNRDGFIWALDDVSFEVHEGEVVGLIGRNGAGKTTLLKILSRITAPTRGYAELNGRVGSLLEVGTGFHPELTGSENIYLNGAILGMKRAEIRRKFDEIVEFAGVQRFMDVPVKRYSSGMYVRLAFAVAAHLEPEILVIDEVLAVGDVEFQKKCLGKMHDVAQGGRTVFFVSHNMQAISTLTQRALLLSHGRCVRAGPTGDIISEYLRTGSHAGLVYAAPVTDSKPQVTRVELRTTEPNNVQLNGDAMEVHLQLTTPAPIDGASLSLQVCDSFQHPILHLWTFDSEHPMCRDPGTFHLTCRIPKLRLYIGRYSLTVHFSDRAGREKYELLEGICPFEVVMYGRDREFGWEPRACVYLEDCEWNVQPVHDDFAVNTGGVR